MDGDKSSFNVLILIKFAPWLKILNSYKLSERLQNRNPSFVNKIFDKRRIARMPFYRITQNNRRNV
jgi:hypothetical protein